MITYTMNGIWALRFMKSSGVMGCMIPLIGPVDMPPFHQSFMYSMTSLLGSYIRTQQGLSLCFTQWTLRSGAKHHALSIIGTKTTKILHTCFPLKCDAMCTFSALNAEGAWSLSGSRLAVLDFILNLKPHLFPSLPHNPLPVPSFTLLNIPSPNNFSLFHCIFPVKPLTGIQFPTVADNCFLGPARQHAESLEVSNTVCVHL